jgi:DNA polymerase/3'-5' exonuclease PolX
MEQPNNTDPASDRRFMPDKVRRPRVDLLLAVTQIEYAGYIVAGSYRREKPDVGDLDILIPPQHDFGVAIETFQQLFGYEAIRSGGMKSEGITIYRNIPLNVNLWRIPNQSSYAGLLLFATGPYDLNIAMRARAKSRNLTLSQYGLFRPTPEHTDEQLDSGHREEEIFRLLGYEYLTPYERETWKDKLRSVKVTHPVVNVKSSGGDDMYQVELSEDGKAIQCECKGFTYRQKCRHLQEAERLYRQQKST